MKSLFFVMTLCFLALSSCAMEELVDKKEVVGKYTYVFHGSNAPESKVSIGDKTDGKWPVLWEKGDAVGVYKQDGTFVGSASVADGCHGGNKARLTLSSNIKLSSGEPVYFVYPYSSGISFSDGVFSVSLHADQSRKSSGVSDGIGNNALAYSSAIFNGDKTEFVLNHVNAYVRVNITPGEFVGYTLKGVTLWGKGEPMAGKVGVSVSDASVEMDASEDYVWTTLQQPVVMENGKTYTIWLTSLPTDFTGKEIYAIVHMAKGDETVTLPIHLKGAGRLKGHTVTNIPLPALSKSFAPSWYEPVEKRYIAAYGKGWAYGPQNTVLFTQSEDAQTVEFKARGNFMKVVEPKMIQVVYASDLAASATEGIVFIDGQDSFVDDDYQIFNLDDNYSQSIAMKKYYRDGKWGGHMAALMVMDAEYNVIWGTNLWLATKSFVTKQYANGEVLDRNIGSDYSASSKNHWSSNGCYFQWGRPWAFPWTKDITGAREMRVDETVDLAWAVSSPYTFLHTKSEPHDWLYGDGNILDRSGDLDDLWGNPNKTTEKTITSSGVKSIYDPCPEGYMVVSPGILAELEQDIPSNVVTDKEPNYLLYKGVAWGFAGGYPGTANGSSLVRNESNLKDFLAIWSNSNSGAYGRALWYYPLGDPQKLVEREKTSALPVRCMVEVRNVNGTSFPSGPNGGSSGGEVDDEEIKAPEGFVEENNDTSADPQGTFDYSILGNAGHPRLLSDAAGFASLKRKVTTDRMYNGTLYNLHKSIITRADKLIEADATFTTTDEQATIVNNLLHCAYAYRMTGEAKYLDKVKTDMQKVCDFPDWAPNDLPIGEISLAMALAYDWLYYDLPYDLRVRARENMSTKGVRPICNKSYASTYGNWNSVCLGGCSLASLAVYEKDKAAAVKQLEKALAENGPAMAKIYEPDGNYGEGLGYWEYGSGFQACFMSALEGIFGHTAGIAQTPGFMESGEYALFMHGTVKSQFSYSDGGNNNDPLNIASWWFAAKNDDPDIAYCEKRRLDRGNYFTTTSTTYRLLPAIVVMIRDFDMESRVFSSPTKEVWSGRGELPVTIVRKGWRFDDSDVYLGIKGGHCNTWKTSATSHAHMDAGSFVFEAEGVRWSDDTKKPDYAGWFAALKDAGSRSGDTSQSGLRWDSFKVNNLSHSTIVSFTNDGSVSGKLHDNDYYVDGYASIDQVLDDGVRQGAVVNMSGPMKGQVKSAKRTIELVNGTDLVVTDDITALDALDCRLEWRMLTAATAEVSSDHVALTGNDVTRNLTVKTSGAAVAPVFMTWEAARPDTDYWKTPAQMGWKDMSWDAPIADRIIAGWSATVPAGKTIRFVTTLKK